MRLGTSTSVPSGWRLFASGLIAWVALATPRKAPAEDSRPNVILVLADDLGYSDLGCYGSEITTPNLDALAAGGIRMSQFYNSARCCPTRASLMTGLYPHQAGIGSFARSRPDHRRGPAYLGHLTDDCVTLAEVLKSTGYQTYMVGKWHMGNPGPVSRGFDEFYGFTQGHSQDQWSPEFYHRLPDRRTPEIRYTKGEFYATDVFNEYALEFIKQAREGDAPWFLYLAHSSPHFPIQAPAETVDRFVDTYRRGWDQLRRERFERMEQNGLAIDGWTLTGRSLVPVDKPAVTNGYSGKPNPAWESLPEKRREDLARRMAVFAAMVYHIDQGIGRIVADLKEHGDFENTLILFTSDNGACYEWGPFGFDGRSRKGITILREGDDLRGIGGPGTHQSYGSAWSGLSNTPFRLYKHFTHEGGICSPMLAHWPAGFPAKKDWIRQPGHVMDIMATLCDATGTTYPEEVDRKRVKPLEGTSLLPLWRGVERLPERVLGFEHQVARAFRKGKWKVVWSKRMPFEIAWELYNLETDRCETQNLAKRLPEQTRALADEWLEWAEKVKVYPFFKPEGRQSGQVEKSGPAIAGKPLIVSCSVDSRSGDGVIVAQGGNRNGYAVHIEKGCPAFSVRINGSVTSIAATSPAPEAFSVTARLRGDGEMILEMDGQRVAEGQAAGLIPVQPMDGLSQGCDSRSAVGHYRSPNPLDAKISNLKVTAGK